MIPYNPCGAIVDWSRFRYRTACRFFRDTDLESEIIWYPAAPNARCLPFDSAIFNREWDRDGNLPLQGKGVGEVPDAPRVISHLGTPPGAVGNHQCGTRSDFEIGAAYDPAVNVEYRPDGLPVCCPGGVGGFLWGGRMPTLPVGGTLWGGASNPVTLSGSVVFPNDIDLDTPQWGRFVSFFVNGYVRSSAPVPAGTYHVRWSYAYAPSIYTVQLRAEPPTGFPIVLATSTADTGCISGVTPADGYRLRVDFARGDTLADSRSVFFAFASGAC